MFEIKPYPFGDLAQMYYPDHNYQSALLHFREEMHLTRGMWKAMMAEGYHENTKTQWTKNNSDNWWESIVAIVSERGDQ